MVLKDVLMLFREQCILKLSVNKTGAKGLGVVVEQPAQVEDYSLRHFSVCGVMMHMYAWMPSHVCVCVCVRC